MIVSWNNPADPKGGSLGRKVVGLLTIFWAVATPVPTVYPIPSHILWEDSAIHHFNKQLSSLKYYRVSWPTLKLSATQTCRMSILLHGWKFEFKILPQKRVNHDLFVFTTKRANPCILCAHYSIQMVKYLFQLLTGESGKSLLVWVKYTGAWG